MPSEQPPAPEASDADTPAADASAPDAPDAMPLAVRRAPRFRAFVLAGAVVGLVIGVVLVIAGAGRSTTDSPGVALLFVGGLLTMVGALVGAVVAVLADRASQHR